MSRINIAELTVRGEAEVARLKHLARVNRDIEHALIHGEAMPKTSQIRVKVYDGPHHGRILLIPTGKRVFVLPNPMPAGEMFAAGRSRPQDFAHLREVTYELRTPMHGGEPYLGYVEQTRNNFVIPQEPTIRVSNNALTLVRKLRDETYNYSEGSNGTTTERYAMMQRAEKALVEYIAKIERESYPSIYQGATLRY